MMLPLSWRSRQRCSPVLSSYIRNVGFLVAPRRFGLEAELPFLALEGGLRRRVDCHCLFGTRGHARRDPVARRPGERESRLRCGYGSSRTRGWSSLTYTPGSTRDCTTVFCIAPAFCLSPGSDPADGVGNRWHRGSLPGVRPPGRRVLCKDTVVIVIENQPRILYTRGPSPDLCTQVPDTVRPGPQPSARGSPSSVTDC